MNDMIRLDAPKPKEPQQCSPPDPRIKRLRSLRDGIQRNTLAITRIVDELIEEVEAERDRAA